MLESFIEYLPAWMFLAPDHFADDRFPGHLHPDGHSLGFRDHRGHVPRYVGHDLGRLQRLAAAHLGDDEKRRPHGRAVIRFHGRHPGAIRPGRGPARHHGHALRAAAGRIGHLGGDRRGFAGRLHRYCRGHGGDHGPVGRADHAPAELSKGVGLRHGLRLRNLGQIIPPSIVLVLIGDIVQVPVGDLFMGAILPGIILVLLYILYIGVAALIKPDIAPPISTSDLGLSAAQVWARVAKALIPPLVLILFVLGSIFAGVASPTEAAAVGAVGAILLTAANKRFSMEMLREVMVATTNLTCMVFIILAGANAFGLIFRGLGGDDVVRDFLVNIADHHGKYFVLATVMGLIFIVGFFLDFIEITFIHVPVLAPIMIEFGFDPVWLCILIAVNLQTSFMTPPFGFSLFYLKAVTPPEIQTGHIYRGIIPFVVLQLFGLLTVAFFPELATWLPKVVFGS